MIELMAVLAIMGLGIAALLQTIGWGIYYARDTENNIKAINIAREWIEGVTNIRDTNWLRFSSDKINCWKTDSYNGNCIGNNLNSTNGVWNTNISSWSYTLHVKNGVWFFSWWLSGLVPWSTLHKDLYKVWISPEGFYTQTGVSVIPCSSWKQSDCLTIFTREITIGYAITDTWSFLVQSSVYWQDRRPQWVTLETKLTNWKSNF